MGLHFHVKFEGDATYTEITELVKFDSVKFSTSLCNDKFKFSQDTVKAETIYDKATNDKFFSATKYLPCYVTYDLQDEQMYGYDAISTYGYSEGNNYGFLSPGRIFTGAIYPNTKEILRDYPTEGVSFEIVDNAYLLDKDCEEITIPESFGDIWNVFNPANKDYSFIHKLLYKAGFTDDMIASDKYILKEIGPLIFKANDDSLYEIISNILYEFHHVFYFDENGIFRIYDWKHDTISISEVITENDILDSDGIIRERNILDFDGYKTTFIPISLKENALVYRANLGEDGHLLIPNQTFPTDGEIKEVLQKFSNEWLTEESDIIASYNHAFQQTSDGTLTIITEKYNHDNAQIVVKNNTASDIRLNQFDIRADVYYEDGEEEELLPADLTKSEDIDLDYAKTSIQAHEFAEALYNNTIKYGQYLYKFSSINSYDLNNMFTLTNRDYSVNILIISKQYNYYEHKFKYTAIGIGENIAQIGGEVYLSPSGNPSYEALNKTNAYFAILNNIDEFPSPSSVANNGHVYIHGFTLDNIGRDIDGKIKYSNSGSFFINIPKQTIDLTAPVFQNVEIDRNFWTYLVLDNNTITPVWYSIADATFYDASSIEVTSGIIIGQVKVGTIAPTHTNSIIWESQPFDVARELITVKQAQIQQAFSYLSQATNAIEFEQYAQNLGITDFFTTLAVWELFVDKLYVKNLKVGTGVSEEVEFDCVQFNGTSGYAETSAFSIAGTNRTFEMWVKPDIINSYTGLFVQNTNANDASSNNIVGFQGYPNSSNEITLAIGSGSAYYITGKVALPTGVWTHLAGVIEGGVSAKIYLNGNLIINETISIYPSTGSLKVIMGRIMDKYLDGMCRDFRIWNTVRTQQQIQDNMLADLVGNESGLIALWKANEMTGTTLTDSVGSNDATATGISWVTDIGVISGTGFKFTAVQDDGTGKSRFDVYYNGERVFEANPQNGKVYFGTNFWYDPADGAIHTPNNKTVIRADGIIEAVDGDFKGHIEANSGLFKGVFDTTALKLEPGDGSSESYSQGAGALQTENFYNYFIGKGLLASTFYSVSFSVSSITVKNGYGSYNATFNTANIAYVQLYKIWNPGVLCFYKITFYDSEFNELTYIQSYYSKNGATLDTNLSRWITTTITLTIAYGGDKLIVSSDIPTIPTGLSDYQMFIVNNGDGTATLKVKLP